MSSEAWNVVSYEEAEEGDPATLSPEFASCALVDALHDSPFRMTHATRCFPGTHVQAKQDLSTWLAAYSPHNQLPETPALAGSGKFLETNFCFLWLHGAAGTGKTALMQTLADVLLPPSTTSVSVFDDRQATNPPTYESNEFGSIGIQYGGTGVFLSKEHQLNDATKIWTTIAVGLARRLPPLSIFIQSAFDANKVLFLGNSVNPREHAKVLIFDPIRTWVAAEEGEVDVDLIIIIDGLDECDDKEMQVEIIEIIRDLCTKKIEGVRWHWVFSSRTEMRLREVLVGNHGSQKNEILVELASDAEMDAFLNCGFAQIRAMHDIYPVPADQDRTSFQTPPGSPLPGIHEEWPTPQDKLSIKWQVAGQYAAAASILDYIAKPDDDPRARIVLIDSFVGNKDPGTDHPFAKLDTLYKNILTSVPLASVSTTKRILGAISCLQPSSYEQKPPTISLVAELFDMKAVDVHQALYDLHSVVSAPCRRTPGASRRSSLSAYNREGEQLSFHHPSFDQFLRIPSRSLEWALHLESVHMDLARCCLRKLALGNMADRLSRDRWYMHCWRTGKDTEAALGILPDLFEFDYTLLPGHSVVDRYFIEWLLHLQESTMSEYQLLNPGPLIKLRAHRSLASSNVTCSFDNNQPFASGSSGANTASRTDERKMDPPRKSYILGYEPSKQVYLVPFYDEKVQARADVGLFIAPGLKHWDWIRGFRVVQWDGGVCMELISGEQEDFTC